MEIKIALVEAKKLFSQLAAIEIRHQERILKEYNKITNENNSLEDFRSLKLANILEGGLTTGEYIDMFGADVNSATEVIGLAMSIEGQALDLYLRAAGRAADDAGKKILLDIAAEERTHLGLLGKLLDGMK